MKAPESLIADLWRDFIGADPALPAADVLPRIIPIDAEDLKYPSIVVVVIRDQHRNPKCYKLKVHVRLVTETQPKPTPEAPNPPGTSAEQALAWLQLIDARCRDRAAFIAYYMATLSEADRTGWEIVKLLNGTAVEVSLNTKERSRVWEQQILMWLAVD